MTEALMVVFCLATLPLLATTPAPVTLGSGERGLVFTWMIPKDPTQPYDTVAFACDMKPGYDVTEGFDSNNPETQVIMKETLTPEYRSQFDPRFWAGWVTCRIYSFSEDAAFSGADLYRIEQGHIRIYPGQSQAEARRIYGLTENQRFLGAFDGRVFYWTSGQPHEVLFQSGAQVYRFKLQQRVTQPLGIAKGEPKGDLAMFAVAKPVNWFHVAPRAMDWFVLNLEDAERVK